MPDPGDASLAVAVGLFAASAVVILLSAVVILLAGTRLTAVADILAERTGLGEAVVGAVLLGAATSLSGIVTSVTAAADGRAELAVSNAVGGIAAQTVFLAVADDVYRRAEEALRKEKKDLEDRANELENILGQRVQVKAVAGDPAATIQDTADEGEVPTLIAVGRRGLGAVRKLVMGSISTEVLRNTTHPVLIV